MATDPTTDINWWITRRAALYKAYTSGVKEVRFETRVDVFRSMDELAQAISYCDGMIGSMGGTPFPPFAYPAAGRVRTTRVDMYE
jgi:hypothetical protein